MRHQNISVNVPSCLHARRKADPIREGNHHDHISCRYIIQSKSAVLVWLRLDCVAVCQGHAMVARHHLVTSGKSPLLAWGS